MTIFSTFYNEQAIGFWQRFCRFFICGRGKDVYCTYCTIL